MDHQQHQKQVLKARAANDFTYHAPFGDQVARYAQIRDRIRELALFIIDATPVSREQSLALTALEQAMFNANAAIARNEVPTVNVTVISANSSNDEGPALQRLQEALQEALNDPEG
ncbi:MAG: hypothetical protein WCZ86_06160 [Desulfurivibrionaceae bacterium]